MSNVINDLIDAYQGEIDKLSRRNDPVWETVYDELAGRRGRWDTNEADKAFNSLATIFEYYYNTRYPDKNEDTVFQYALEDALKFKWAKTLERYTNLPATEKELAEMENILSELSQVEKDIALNGRTRAQDRYGNQARGYGSQDRYNAPRHVAQHSHVRPVQGSGYQPKSAFSTGESASTSTPRGRYSQSRYTREEEQPESRNYNGNPRDRRTKNDDDYSEREVENMKPDVSRDSPEFDLDAFVTHRNRYHPDVKKDERGRWVITSMEAAKRFSRRPTSPHYEYVDPWSERMKLYLDNEGYIVQEILEIKNMRIEDHEWVIQPKQHKFAKTPPPELLQPLIVVKESELEIHKSNEVFKHCDDIIAEWVQSGKLPKGTKKLIDVKDDDQRGEVLHQANQRLIKSIEALTNAKAVEKVKDVPAAGKQNPFFTLMEEEDSPQLNGEAMKLIQLDQSLPIRNFKDAANYVLTKQPDEARNEGATVHYERTDVLYRTENKGEYDKLKEITTPLKFRSRNLYEAFRLLNNEGALPRDLVLVLDAKGTELVNHALEKVLGLPWSASSFLEDFQELSKMLNEKVKKGELNPDQLDVFAKYVESKLCNLAFPTIESLKAHFSFGEDELAAQSVKCLHEYDCGTFVYLPYNAVDLGLNLSGVTRMGERRQTKVTAALSGADMNFNVVLGTKDNRFFQVLEDKEEGGYFIFSTKE